MSIFNNFLLENKVLSFKNWLRMTIAHRLKSKNFDKTAAFYMRGYSMSYVYFTSLLSRHLMIFSKIVKSIVET